MTEEEKGDYKMDVYVMIHGQNPQKEEVLKLVGLTESKINRFRDCGYDFEKKVLWVLARTGSTNAFNKDNKQLEQYSNFIGNKDDDFDSTYEWLFFKPIPLMNMSNIKNYPIPNIQEVLHNGINDMEQGRMNEATKRFMKEMENKIKNSSGGIISLLDEN